MEYLVTFDYVFAPGYEITSKRYAIGGTESFQEIDIDERLLMKASGQNQTSGLEGINMLTDSEVRRICGDRDYRKDGELIARRVVGERSIIDARGNFMDAASLCYRR